MFFVSFQDAIGDTGDLTKEKLAAALQVSFGTRGAFRLADERPFQTVCDVSRRPDFSTKPAD